MKKCFYCGSKKQHCKRNGDLKVTVVCDKCGLELKCPTFDEAYAKGCWNTKMAELERAEKENREAAVE